MDYKLKIQQLVDYPRCRIYRKLIKTLIGDQTIRTNGNTLLFYFMILCSMANFRTSYYKHECENITVAPGEWVISLDELAGYCRKRLKKDVIAILDKLKQMDMIDYTVLGAKHSVRYQIRNWSKFNAVIEDNAPCTKDEGFFFFPFSYVKRFIQGEKASEMDIILDLWLNTIYSDPRVKGSEIGPVVYFRNGTGSPLIGYEELGKRYGISKSTAGRIMRKLEDNGYIKTVSFQGNYGSTIYLCNYLSTMFNISDVLIDKLLNELRQEVAMSLNINVRIPDEKEEVVPKNEETTENYACQNDENEISDARIRVPNEELGVPKSHIRIMVKKVLKVLAIQGIACATCARTQYILYPLSDDCIGYDISSSDILELRLIIRCPGNTYEYKFDMRIEKITENDSG